jgi:high-affinity Fe2+/Pb2+ permease
MELGNTHGYAIFTVVAITVLREGIESVIFLAGGCAVLRLCSAAVVEGIVKYLATDAGHQMM